jgi:hypothetical protein
MFSRNKEPTLLEREFDRALRALSTCEVGSQEYVKTLDVISTLHTVKKDHKPSSVSRDTLAIVAANLLGILMIIKHEDLNPITSRAMNLVMKPR